jgi:peptide/nickel transport system substrate-binding protein
MKKFFLIALVLITGALPVFAKGQQSAGTAAVSSGGIDKSQALNYFLPSNPTMLDPALTSDGVGGLLSLVTEALLATDRDFKLIPNIAESWTANADSTRFTFKIKPGVMFTDGTPCDAAAIKWNYDRQLKGNATPDMPYAEEIFGLVTSIEAPDAVTLIINQSESNSTLPIYLAMANGTGICSPTAWKKDPIGFQRRPVGAGAYIFQEWVDDQYVKYTANPNYHGGEVQNAGIYFRVIKETSVQTSEYLAGGIDYLEGVPVTDIDRLTAQGMTVGSTPGFSYTMLSFADYAQNPIFKDKRVRQAVWHALDREALVNAVYNSRAYVANSIIPKGMTGGDEPLKVYEYNPARAKALLAEAGYPNGFTFRYVCRSEPEHVNMAAAVKMELAKVNINMEIESLQKGEWLEKILAEKPDHDACSFNWGAASNDPAYMAALWVSTNGGTGFNTSGYNNSEFDRRINDARKTGDQAVQAKLYGEAAQMVADDAPVVFFHSSASFWSKGPNIVDPENLFGSFDTRIRWKIGKRAR